MINLSLLITLFLVVAFWPWIYVEVPAGHLAIKWYRFSGGTDTETVYGEGGHFIFPWNKMAVYDGRVQQISRDFDVLTRDGLMMTVTIAVRFRLNDTTVGLVHKHVGTEYLDTLLVPTIGSYARIIFSQNSTDDMYTGRREVIQGEIKEAAIHNLIASVGSPGRQNVPWLFLEDVLICGMRFPPEVQAAINRKMEQYQLRQEYAYRLEREQLESRRKEVEAQGIARFQSIVGAGISDTYLRWKGIDATLALAQSPNAKVVVIGTGRDGMPLILGGGDALPSGASGNTVIRQDTAASPTIPPESNSGNAVLLPDIQKPETSWVSDGALGNVVDALRRLAGSGRPEALQRQAGPSPVSGASQAPSSATAARPGFVPGASD
jgi:regulator of protease activity HflC (stomatin/prohibitin superfamily)